MQSNDYRNTFGLNQSAIKDFRFKSPKKWKSIWINKLIEEKNEDYLTFGSLVDVLLFTPHLLEKQFYIADVSVIPKGGIEKIIHSVYNAYKALGDDMPEDVKRTIIMNDPVLPEVYEETTYNLHPLKEEIIRACKEEAWQPTWKEDTKVNKVIEKGTDYFRLLEAANGREIITTQVNFEAIAMVNRLRTDESVMKYFTEGDGHRNLYQVQLHDTFVSEEGNEVPIKCAIDIVHIDYKSKTVQLVDFKTSYSAFDFLKSIKQYSYCDQLSFYEFMLKRIMKNSDFLEEHSIESDFKFLNPINVVIDSEENTPYIYEYNAADLKIAREGNGQFLYYLYETNEHGTKIKKGWLTILEDICWHLKTDLWDYPRDYYANGRIKVNLLNT